MTLRNQLRVTKMIKNDTIATYFIKVSQLKDQLAAINENIDDSELTTLTLNGFPFLGEISFKVSVQEKYYLNLINFGPIVHKKKLGFFLWKILKMKRIKPWLPILRKVRGSQVLK